jgi:hypothetical protein
MHPEDYLEPKKLHKTIAKFATDLGISAFVTVKTAFEMGTEVGQTHRTMHREMAAHQAKLKTIRDSLRLYQNRHDC